MPENPIFSFPSFTLRSVFSVFHLLTHELCMKITSFLTLQFYYGTGGGHVLRRLSGGSTSFQNSIL